MQAVTCPFSDEAAEWWADYRSQPVSIDPILKPTLALMLPMFASIHRPHLLFILLHPSAKNTNADHQ